MSDADVIVVGSGASAVQTAWALVEAGHSVRMLDYGNEDTHYAPLIPDGRFDEIRRRDAGQHRYFLGDRFEGIGLGSTGAGPQLTPPRQFVTRDVDRLLPVASESFFPLESLAQGGLAGAWGAGCPPFADADLQGMPLSRAELGPHYERIAGRIGVSGADDDLVEFLGELRAMQPAVEVDRNAATLLARYEARRRRLNRAGFFLGRPRLAMLSRPLGTRRPTSYDDMDFWSDRGRSVYRPRWTLDELRERDNFDYRGALLVQRFREEDDRVVVHAARAAGGQETHHARALVLAAGTLGTARIVLRSTGRPGQRLPLVCNPHTYIVTLNLGMLGKPPGEARHSLAQLCFVDAPDGPRAATTVGHLYSYRSLQLFRLARDAPLPVRQSLGVFRELMSALAILIVQHADSPTSAKSCGLASEDPSSLVIDYALSAAERQRTERIERRIVSRFRSIGCLPLRRVHQAHAASVHYAGTLPMCEQGGELTTDPDARLRGTRGVWVADGSVFPTLPSRGLTFTMMAHADRVGLAVGRVLAAEGHRP